MEVTIDRYSGGGFITFTLSGSPFTETTVFEIIALCPATSILAGEVLNYRYAHEHTFAIGTVAIDEYATVGAASGDPTIPTGYCDGECAELEDIYDASFPCTDTPPAGWPTSAIEIERSVGCEWEGTNGTVTVKVYKSGGNWYAKMTRNSDGEVMFTAVPWTGSTLVGTYGFDSSLGDEQGCADIVIAA